MDGVLFIFSIYSNNYLQFILVVNVGHFTNWCTMTLVVEPCRFAAFAFHTVPLRVTASLVEAAYFQVDASLKSDPHWAPGTSFHLYWSTLSHRIWPEELLKWNRLAVGSPSSLLPGLSSALHCLCCLRPSAACSPLPYSHLSTLIKVIHGIITTLLVWCLQPQDCISLVHIFETFKKYFS